MTYGKEGLSDLARDIQQYIRDSTMFETSPEAIKGNAAWWASQVGADPEDTRSALEELVRLKTLVKHDEGPDATYIFVPVTGVSPELRGEG